MTKIDADELFWRKIYLEIRNEHLYLKKYSSKDMIVLPLIGAVFSISKIVSESKDASKMELIFRISESLNACAKASLSLFSSPANYITLY